MPEFKKHCRVDDASCRLLESAIDKLGLSARAYNRTLKTARTIADLEKSGDINTAHISEAIQYRNLDRGKQFKQIFYLDWRRPKCFRFIEHEHPDHSQRT